MLMDKPRNDLLFHVSDWIFKTIGLRTPPVGSVFEIEAKLGVIMDTDRGDRVRLPVLSEAVFDRSRWPGLKTKFDTSMMSSVSADLPYLIHTVFGIMLILMVYSKRTNR